MKRGREPGWAPCGGSGLGQQAVCGRVSVPVSLCVCPRVRLCPRVSPLTAKPTQKVRLCPRGQPRLSGSALKIAGFLKERCFEPKIQGVVAFSVSVEDLQDAHECSQRSETSAEPPASWCPAVSACWGVGTQLPEAGDSQEEEKKNMFYTEFSFPG